MLESLHIEIIRKEGLSIPVRALTAMFAVSPLLNID
jgi:hypothetical protein